MSDQPPYPPSDPNQPGWGQPPPPPPPGGDQPGWGQQPPPPPGGGSYGGPPGSGNYNPTEAISYGWKAFRANPGPLLAATALVLVVTIVIQVIAEMFSNDSFFNPVGMVFTVLGSLVGMVLGAAAIRISLDVVDGREVNLNNMFNFDWLQVIIASVILSIATTIGLILCIVPGLVILFLTFLTNYFIVARGEDAITAIKSSVELTKNNIGPLLVLTLLAFACMIAGFVACCIGIFVAYPVVTVATAYTFRTLQNEPVRPY